MNTYTEFITTVVTDTAARVGGKVTDQSSTATTCRVVAHFHDRSEAESTAALLFQALYAPSIELIEQEDVASSMRDEGYRTALIVYASTKPQEVSP